MDSPPQKPIYFRWQFLLGCLLLLAYWGSFLLSFANAPIRHSSRLKEAIRFTTGEHLEDRLWWVPEDVRKPDVIAFEMYLRCDKATNWKDAILIPGENREDVLGYAKENFRPTAVASVVSQAGNAIRLQWHLREATPMLAIYLPAGCEILIDSFQQITQPTNFAWFYLKQVRWILLCSAIACLVLPYLGSWKSFLARHSRTLLIGYWGVQGLVFIWLMPPFQVPDENRHWKQGLNWLRSESTLIDLPNILDAEAVRFQGGQGTRWQLLRSTPIAPFFSEVEKKGASYAGPWAYPWLMLVAVLHPPIDAGDVSQAVFFYRLCKVVPLCVGLTLLILAVRKIAITHLTLVIFSFPLVQQQMLAISPDSILILGTMLLYLLLVCSHVRSWKWVTGLMLLVLWLVASKPPIYAPLLLLPLLNAPPRPWPWKRICFILLTLALMGVAGGYIGYQLIQRDTNSRENFEKQMAVLKTEEGRTNLLTGLWDYREVPITFRSWVSPLGWVDLDFHSYHLVLISLAMFLGLFMDLLEPTPPKSDGHTAHWNAILWGILILAFFFVWIVLGTLWFVTISPVGSSLIYGLQFRYFFPIVAIGLCHLAFPRWLREMLNELPTWLRGENAMLGCMMVMIVLLLQRMHELVTAILVRYG